MELLSNKEKFRLLDLPLELVVRVLGFAVLFKQEDQFEYHPTAEGTYCKSFYTTKFHFWAQPAITRSCRLLRSEGLPLFYSGNHFSLTGSEKDAAKLWTWAGSPALQHTKQMKQFHVQITGLRGERWPRKFTDMTFNDFMGEADFQRATRESTSDEITAFLRMVGTKVRLSFVASKEFTFYELSFVDHTPDEWRELDRFEDCIENGEHDEDEEIRQRCLATDWWTEEPQPT